MTGAFVFPKVQAIPGVDRASLLIDGVERVSYHFGEGTTGPFLFPIVGPSGALLTRLGSLSSSENSPERSLWIGHKNLAGHDFWNANPGSDVKIRHRTVSRFWDGAAGGMAIHLDWWAKGEAVLRQTLEVQVVPTKDRGFALDLLSRFESTGAPVEFGQSDLGFLGLRVAKTMSESLGGGRATSSEGTTGAQKIHGASARWVDFSGPSAPNTFEGIAILDHPLNANRPTTWTVQADGLIGAAFNASSPYGVALDHPLELRYRLLVHAGPANPSVLDRAWEDFARESRSREIG